MFGVPVSSCGGTGTICTVEDRSSAMTAPDRGCVEPAEAGQRGDHLAARWDADVVQCVVSPRNPAAGKAVRDSGCCQRRGRRRGAYARRRGCRRHKCSAKSWAERSAGIGSLCALKHWAETTETSNRHARCAANAKAFRARSAPLCVHSTLGLCPHPLPWRLRKSRAPSAPCHPSLLAGKTTNLAHPRQKPPSSSILVRLLGRL